MIEFRKKLFLFYVGAFAVFYLANQLTAEQSTLVTMTSKASVGIQTLISYMN